LEEALKVFIEKVDPVMLAMLAVIVVLAWLLVRAMGRVDGLVREFSRNSETLAKLTTLVENLVYGRKKE
jgi:flagellar biogenesis protein FliO